MKKHVRFDDEPVRKQCEIQVAIEKVVEKYFDSAKVYSYKFRANQECLAVSLPMSDDISFFMYLGAELARMKVDELYIPEDVEENQLGKGVVIYWPKIKYIESK